ncbi:V8-like Glu-specific endopeptidase [Streptosporangium album]|uniref:V8-like Glu-specific endopeptidase n=1 Tax=Streptosporangium album TaxID=47479 RepID=A0A7W7RY86_9ACTN|nr:peptidase [Streptosporangium album]MBB4940473.1 V8-like Glu-specific endopeptidase [Streptosporangium album]
MRRTARLVPILTLVAGGTLLPAAVAHGTVATAAGPHPIEKEAADTRTEQRTVQRYWTEAKMEAAQPLDSLAPKKSGVRLAAAAVAAQAAAEPVSVPATSPDGDTVMTVQRSAPARASTGSPWKGRGAISTTAGRIFFTYQGRNASCSGNAVTSDNKSTVITAGHCVKMGGAFHSNWVFVPGYDNGDRPHGTWVATTLYTTPQWNNSEDVNYDVAAAVVAPLDGRSLTDVVGGQGVSFNQARRQQMHSFGYPAASPYDGSKLVYCAGRAFDDFLMSRDIGLNCAMTGGSSGGPWFVDFNETTGLGTLNSVNSFKYGFAGGWMFGPYFGTDAQAVYEAAQSTDTPRN